jgi:hypothetical protein
MKIYLLELWVLARHRAPGFLDDVLEHSKLDRQTAAIELSAETHDKLTERWPVQAKIRGLGDVPKLLDPEARERLRKQPQEPGCC